MRLITVVALIVVLGPLLMAPMLRCRPHHEPSAHSLAPWFVPPYDYYVMFICAVGSRSVVRLAYVLFVLGFNVFLFTMLLTGVMAALLTVLHQLASFCP